MAITASDIRFYKALYNNDLTSNGGVVSTTQVVTNVVNNLFPNVENAERVAGITRYRKEFIMNWSAEDMVLYHGLIWIDTPSNGADYFLLHLGTDTDTQAEADDYTDWAGAGVLNVIANIDDPTIDVAFEATEIGVFDGAMIRIDDGTQVEYKTVVGEPVWVGLVATLTLDSAISYTFSASNTRVMTVIDLGNLLPEIASWVESSSLGSYDEETYPLTLYNIGSVSDSWTLTFTSATAFNAVGVLSGSVGAGDTSEDFQPENGGSYYFKLDADGWGGTWAAGDQITFATSHAGQALWLKQIVPAGIASLSNNRVTLEGSGESASATTTTTTSTTTTSSSTSSTASTTSTQSTTSSTSSTASSTSSTASTTSTQSTTSSTTSSTV